jgi:SAM-dependent methyltransferase
MPMSAMFPERSPLPADVQILRVAAQHVAEALRTGSCPADRCFDRFLPDDLRVVSGQYWTPLVVAKRAAEWFDDLGVRTVVDIGSGAGKFCVAAALVGRSRFTGLEQRRSLVASARALATVFDVRDRVSFVQGAVGTMATPNADAYYLYNPFAEYVFGSSHDVDTDVEFNETRQAHDVAAVEQLLGCAPAGTYVLTYNGFGGRVPAGYKQIRVDRNLPNDLRLWRKERRSCTRHRGLNPGRFIADFDRSPAR